MERVVTKIKRGREYRGHVYVKPAQAGKEVTQIIARTERLVLRHADLTDADFFCRLLNEPSWLQNIGDRGVRTPGDAEEYIQTKSIDVYPKLGFGMYLVESRDSRQPMGLCGLVMREALPHPDLGFAFLPEFWGRGYAFEAAAAVMAHARELGLVKLLAITDPTNRASFRLLEKLGFRFESMTRMSPADKELRLYAVEDY